MTAVPRDCRKEGEVVAMAKLLSGVYGSGVFYLGHVGDLLLYVLVWRRLLFDFVSQSRQRLTESICFPLSLKIHNQEKEV